MTRDQDLSAGDGDPEAALAPFFWLHVKKAAGTSIRTLLAPHYHEVDRRDRPGSFIQAKRCDYNDILNNFRTLIGEYQFRRCLFAKTYLYPQDWDGLVRFAFSRDPVARAVSAFFHFWHRPDRPKVFSTPLDRSFEGFLDQVEESFHSPANALPLGLHFTTHVARLWEDITDQQGQLLLTHIFRLEDMTQGLQAVYDSCGIKDKVRSDPVKLNASLHNMSYQPNPQQIKKLQSLYAKDFDIYEGGCVRF